jgi:predicted amidohydrolase YtcJ
MYIFGRLLVVALIGAVALSCAPSRDQADLVITNGKIVTVDPDQPEVQAVAVIGDRIAAVGKSDEIEAYIGSSTEVIDLEGKLAVPGFIEGHGHFMSLGHSKMVLDLTKTKSWDEIVKMVGQAAAEAEPGEWILGRGWHQEKWDEQPTETVDGLPLHNELSKASPDNPVNLTHASGHGSLANALAMELGGITRETPDPPGGTIVRDEQGNATGALREKAQTLVRRAQSHQEESRSEEERKAESIRAVELAGEDLLSKGITAFHDAGANFATIDFFKELAEQGKLPVRLNVMVRRESNEVMAEKLPDYKMIDAYGGFLTVRSIKRQIDGALGPHGAWLLEPYEDLPGNIGLTLEPPEDIAGTCDVAIQHGFQVATHAIGDMANRATLDIYEEAFKKASVDGTQLRWRIEHSQHVHPDDLPRFAELGIVAAMQGIHCTSDGPWVLKRLGEERAASGAYMWRDFINLGVVVTNGTDVPVEDADPIASFHATVTRLMPNGEYFYPEQKMTREEALKSYTWNNAYAAFEEGVMGSITPGKYADIVVLTKDILTVPDEEILDTQVLTTIVGGKVKYRRETRATSRR